MKTKSELISEGIDVDGAVSDALLRKEGQRGNPIYDIYSEWAFLGANTIEGRDEDYFFETEQEKAEWLDLQ